MDAEAVIDAEAAIGAEAAMDAEAVKGAEAVYRRRKMLATSMWWVWGNMSTGVTRVSW